MRLDKDETYISNGEWWRDAVIYQVYWRSFADGNGDGVGDVAGLSSRLEYIRALGVDAIWITPWYPSPWEDGGYDISDYCGVDPLFGTMEGITHLIDQCHRRNLKLIIDLVPNHTSTTHPWFRSLLEGDPTMQDRYVTREGRGDTGAEPPNNWSSDFGGSAWTRMPGQEGGSGRWYLHTFARGQADLNWESDNTRREFADIIRFWLDLGVDGLRVDAAHALVKSSEFRDVTSEDAARVLDDAEYRCHPFIDRVGVHDIYRSWRSIVNDYDPPRLMVAEVWYGPLRRAARYTGDDQFHSAFNFDFLRCGWSAPDLRQTIKDGLNEFEAVGATASWVLSNHDSVRTVTRYGRRWGQEHAPAGTVAADLTVGTRRARAAALLMLGLPGMAFVYQGEELGLFEVEDLPVDSLTDPTWRQSGMTIRGRDGCRVPIPWKPKGPSFGFGPNGSWLPQPEGWGSFAVETATINADTTLNLYRSALRIRRHLNSGSSAFRWLQSSRNVLSFERSVDGAASVQVLVNLSDGDIPLPPGELLLASEPGVDESLPPDMTAWISVTRG